MKEMDQGGIVGRYLPNKEFAALFFNMSIDSLALFLAEHDIAELVIAFRAYEMQE